MTSLDDSFGSDAAPTRRRRWPWVIVFVLVGALIAIAAVAAVYLWNLNTSYEKAETLPTEEVFPTVRPVEANPEDTNILLLGSDSRSGLDGDLDSIRGQRSDTMLLVHIPADRSGVQVISFMRDNWVEIPGYGNQKLNAALAYGGVPLLVETLENIVDVPINHVMITDFEGFKGLTDALDGVTVNNQVAFTRGGFTFAKGPVTLSGDSALLYVRERYSFPDGDYQRVRNQQAFIKGVIDKMLSRETLTDPGRVAAAVDAISPYLTVDAGLTGPTVASLGVSLRNLRSDDIMFLTSPTLGTDTVAGQSIVRPDFDGLAALSEALKNDTVPEYAAAHPAR
ncbi:Cell envelope-associated transcriptional attenuator LytR-CpsA-Psr, subfamily A1 (as in PMID19099556) [Microbacterium esteraromaticum]|uniref:Cell envelope-associated transcriptional attenuator LytR-CpsA-Psr, subfamily A1 (As in PMID19099556) n=1 Tax=Microbacterium esteraromaticum TaxID=57043 RepID=A0A1R4K9G2_9MICO|nr:LCP family protein [Microbacterium esteraromaticum]SJN40946.1 Cell envelope-associated transcriptional attenuator LytR-CpsA-Psr, subfamily A1 (as in PMID19099556) [Microbacterium esteraromaticum]